jgi:hypothetical protein
MKRLSNPHNGHSSVIAGTKDYALCILSIYIGSDRRKSPLSGLSNEVPGRFCSKPLNFVKKLINWPNPVESSRMRREPSQRPQLVRKNSNLQQK